MYGADGADKPRVDGELSMKIIYCIAGFYRPAGMERVLAGKANWLARHGHEVVIATTDQRGQEAVFPLDPGIRLVDLGVNYEENNGRSFLNKVLNYPFKKARHKKMLKDLIITEKPDIVDSMFCGEETFLPKFKDGSRKVLEIHFSRFKRKQYERKGIWRLSDNFRSLRDLRNAARFDKFIVLTKEDSCYWDGIPNLKVICNATPFTFERPACLDSKVVIAVGRYTCQKGLDRLIASWAKVKRVKDGNGWTLRLVGDGEDRPVLEKMIEELGLKDSVVLGKSETEMKSVYSDASILALSSRFEGLPMALIESQSAGVPCVSFDCKCGPRDIVENGKNGILVRNGDIDAFAEGLLRLMKDDALRKNMGSKAFEMSSRFDEETVMKQWMDLFEKLLSSRR